MVNFPCLRSLALSGESCSWLKDDNVTTLLEKGAFKRLQKLSVTGKVSQPFFYVLILYARTVLDDETVCFGPSSRR